MNSIEIKRKYFFDRFNLYLSDLVGCFQHQDYSAHEVLYLDRELFSLIAGKEESGSLIKFGEYPQNFADEETSEKLEEIYKTLTSVSPEKIYPMEENYNLIYDLVHEEVSDWGKAIDFCFNIKKKFKVYEYNGKKYIRVYEGGNDKYSFFVHVNRKSPLWVCVEPLWWIVDRKNSSLISKKRFSLSLIERDEDNIAHVSDEKTEKYLNKVVLKDILQNEKLKKEIEYDSFQELFETLKEHKGYPAFQGLVQIVLQGPALTPNEKAIIRGYLGRRIQVKYEFIEEEEQTIEEKTDYKFKDLEEKIKKDNERIDQKYKEVLLNVEKLRRSIMSLEKEKGITTSTIKRLMSSIFIPEDILLIKKDDHYEFNPEYVELLKYIDLSLITTKNLKLSGLDLRETNISFDPQTIYKKDLRNSLLADHNIVFKSFKGVDLRGADIELEKESFDIDQAITDEYTVFPGGRKKRA